MIMEVCYTTRYDISNIIEISLPFDDVAWSATAKSGDQDALMTALSDTWPCGQQRNYPLSMTTAMRIIIKGWLSLSVLKITVVPVYLNSANCLTVYK